MPSVDLGGSGLGWAGEGRFLLWELQETFELGGRGGAGWEASVKEREGGEGRAGGLQLWSLHPGGAGSEGCSLSWDCSCSPAFGFTECESLQALVFLWEPWLPSAGAGNPPKLRHTFGGGCLCPGQPSPAPTVRHP